MKFLFVKDVESLFEHFYFVQRLLESVHLEIIGFEVLICLKELDFESIFCSKEKSFSPHTQDNAE